MTFIEHMRINEQQILSISFSSTAEILNNLQEVNLLLWHPTCLQYGDASPEHLDGEPDGEHVRPRELLPVAAQDALHGVAGPPRGAGVDVHAVGVPGTEVEGEEGLQCAWLRKEWICNASWIT